MLAKIKSRRIESQRETADYADYKKRKKLRNKKAENSKTRSPKELSPGIDLSFVALLLFRRPGRYQRRALVRAGPRDGCAQARELAKAALPQHMAVSLRLTGQTSKIS